MSDNLVREMLVGRVGFGESFQACPASYSAEDAMAVTIVRLYEEGDELRAEAAMLREQARILAQERDEARAMLERKWAEQDPPLLKMMQERDEARIQYRSTEALGMALVKTIDELKTEKAELSVKLVNLEGRSRRATLDEIAESVRDKYDPRHEGDDDE